MTGDHIPTLHALEQRFEKKEIAIPDIDMVVVSGEDYNTPFVCEYTWGGVLMARSETLPVLLKQLRAFRRWPNYGRLFSPVPPEENWDPAQYLAALCEHELNERYSRRIARFTKESRLPIGKTLATFDFSQTPEISPEKSSGPGPKQRLG